MKALATEQTSTSTVSGDRKKDIGDALDYLAQREAAALRSIGDAMKTLEVIQEERRSLLREVMGKSAVSELLELTPEMADEAIRALKAEFEKTPAERAQAGYLVQEGIDFAAVETKLRAEENKAALASLYRMVQAGARPALVCAEQGRYCIAETFGRTLPERADCVYDREAEQRIGSAHCNGNVVAQARAMGVPLMERHIAQAHLTAFPDNNQYCFDYIQATKEERENGRPRASNAATARRTCA